VAVRRVVTADIEAALGDSTALAFAVAVADGVERDEELELTLDARPIEATALADLHGTRLHALRAGPGRLTLRYRAVVTGQAEPPSVTPLDAIVYARPSRYCPSDALTPTARELFSGLAGHDLLRAVRDWVHGRTAYVSGSSSPTDSAMETLLSRQGVCRDFAHLVIAMLRALDVPARLVAVYAPGLAPMDFHAVVEAAVDGRWFVVDATGLAPRQSLLRISTGRDAADTAFLTNTLADLELTRLEVTATVDELPGDDHTAPVQLG